MYSAELIARYAVNRCAETYRPVSNPKLQRILYFIQAEFLVSAGRPCFPDEIKAEAFGPAVPAVEEMYRIFGWTNIPEQPCEGFSAISASDKKILNGIIDDAARYSARTLTEITRRQHPWKAARCRADKTIHCGEIRAYFAEPEEGGKS